MLREAERMNNSLVKDIVKENSNASKVFCNYGIDYCCNGKITLAQATSELNIDLNRIITELNEVIVNSEKNDSDLDALMPDELIAHIIDKHHGYLYLNLPFIFECGQIAIRENPDSAREITEVLKPFSEMRENLTKHIYKEENIIFPYILNITEAYKNDLKIEIPPFRKIANTLNFMELENNETHSLINKIKEVSNNFSVQESAGKMHKLFYTKLRELEEKIYNHMHIKNNILFPKSIELESVIGALNI